MKPLSRRTVLKGACAAIALPWLEAMAPLQAALHPTRRRSGWHSCTFPTESSAISGFQKNPAKVLILPPTLQPLENLREDITVISGLNRTYLSGEPHSQAGSCWLTSALPNERKDGVTSVDTTLDQVIAREVGDATPFPSLELSCNSFVDNMEPKLFDAISWYGPGNDAKSQNNPADVFKRLFGDAASIKQSVLDTVISDADNLHRRLGVDDRRKLDEYLTSIRAVERRISKQVSAKQRMGKVEMEMPETIPSNRGEFIRLMGDLMILAFRTDQTRIATLMVGPERWQSPQMYDGVFDKPVSHHVLTHDTTMDDKVAKIDRFPCAAIRLPDRATETAAGRRWHDAGPVLFRAWFGIGNGARHSYEQLPMIIAGSGGGQFDTGRHLNCSAGTPLANLWLSLADTMGVKLKRFADSTGKLQGFA